LLFSDGTGVKVSATNAILSRRTCWAHKKKRALLAQRPP